MGDAEELRCPTCGASVEPESLSSHWVKCTTANEKETGLSNKQISDARIAICWPVFFTAMAAALFIILGMVGAIVGAIAGQMGATVPIHSPQSSGKITAQVGGWIGFIAGAAVSLVIGSKTLAAVKTRWLRIGLGALAGAGMSIMLASCVTAMIQSGGASVDERRASTVVFSIGAIAAVMYALWLSFTYKPHLRQRYFRYDRSPLRSFWIHWQRLLGDRSEGEGKARAKHVKALLINQCEHCDRWFMETKRSVKQSRAENSETWKGVCPYCGFRQSWKWRDLPNWLGGMFAVFAFWAGVGGAVYLAWGWSLWASIPLGFGIAVVAMVILISPVLLVTSRLIRKQASALAAKGLCISAVTIDEMRQIAKYQSEKRKELLGRVIEALVSMEGAEFRSYAELWDTLDEVDCMAHLDRKSTRVQRAFLKRRVMPRVTTI